MHPKKSLQPRLKFISFFGNCVTLSLYQMSVLGSRFSLHSYPLYCIVLYWFLVFFLPQIHHPSSGISRMFLSAVLKVKWHVIRSYSLDLCTSLFMIRRERTSYNLDITTETTRGILILHAPAFILLRFVFYPLLHTPPSHCCQLARSQHPYN